jgi:hypothetical protein
MKQKVQGVFPYYLIVVHEEAGDECAHAQLIADRFCYDTEIHPYQRPAKRLELFRRLSHGWQLGLSSSSGLLLSSFSMLWTKTEDSLLGEERNRWERWTTRLAGGRTRAVVMLS